MDTLTIRISPYKREPPFKGVYFTVTAVANGRSLPAYLDVDEFFSSFHQTEWLPIFNCSCGIHSCGGHYMHVRSEAESVTWATRSPEDGPPSSNDWSYQFTWENLREIAGELIATVHAAIANNPGEAVHSALTGVDLAERLPYYQQQYDSLL